MNISSFISLSKKKLSNVSFRSLCANHKPFQEKKKKQNENIIKIFIDFQILKSVPNGNLGHLNYKLAH